MSRAGGSGVPAPEAVRDRLAAVRRRVREAAERAGRDPESITLVAVSKTFAAERVVELLRAGQLVFGENRVQEARDKIPAVSALWDGPPPLWRLIGHLQRNKLRQALDLFGAVDSVDSFRLLDEIEREAARRGLVLPVLLEFNCSGEAAKEGFDPASVAEVAARLGATEGIDPQGLMTIGPLAEAPEAARPAFRLLRELRDELAGRLGRPLPILSMGMSGDLEVGIEEGATMVRVGTALFGARDQSGGTW